MKTAKILSVLLISVMFVSLMTGIVAAVEDTTTGGFSGFIENVINGIKGGGEPIFRALLGETAKNENFIIQILAFLLVVLVVYGVLGMAGIFGSKPWVNMGIGIVVAVLGTRFIPEGFLTQLATPSSAFVAILTLGIPFLLLGFILMKSVDSKLVRKAVWVAYGVLIFVLWMVNVNKPVTEVPTLAKWLYPLILLGIIIAFAFDGTLQKWWFQAKAERVEQTSRGDAMDKLNLLIEQKKQMLASARTDADRDRLAKEIKELEKNRKEI